MSLEKLTSQKELEVRINGFRKNQWIFDAAYRVIA